MWSQKYQDIAQLEDKYSGLSVVNLLDRTHVIVSLDKDGDLFIEMKPTLRKLYLNSSAISNSEESIPYSANFELKDIQAYALNPAGNNYKKEKVETFRTKTEFSPGIFHDGSLSLNFLYPSLSKSSISHLEFTLGTDVPQFLSPISIQSFYPTVRREIILEFDKDIELDYTVHNASADEYQPTIIKTKKATTWQWVFTDVEGYDFDELSPPLSYYSPVIIPRIKSYNYNNQNIRVLGDLKDYYNWCYSFIEKTNTSPSDEIKELVDSIKSVHADELGWIQGIYSWVQDNVKYVAFEEGLQGFIPDNASAVCNKRFGDCKGLTSLLYSMLNYAGTKAYFTWVGTRDTPFLQSEVPTPASQNHMILTYEYNDRLYFMDGTSEFSPVGEPTTMILGKHALIGLDKDNFRLLPIVPPSSDYSVYSDTIQLTLNRDSSLTGKGKSTLTGYYKSGWLSILKSSTQEELTEIMDEFLQKGNNKFKLDHYKLSDLENRQDPFIIEYEFTLKDYVNIYDNHAFVNLNLNPIYLENSLSQKRKTPLQLEYKSINSLFVSMAIPEEYSLDYIPKNDEFENELFGFKYRARMENGIIIQSMEQRDDFLLLQKDKFPEWNEMISKLNRTQRESISLKKK